MNRLEQQMNFITEIDKLKQIQRQTWLSDGSRHENDAEHSWHIALMAFLLKEYANQETDTTKVMTMLLIHDLVEIEAGDTYAYDSANQKTAHDREAKAADHLFHLLPDDQADMLLSLWKEFEDNQTPEALFAHALDNCQPMLLNHAAQGKGWQEHHVPKSSICRRNEKTGQGSEAIWDYMQDILQKNIDRGTIIDDTIQK